MVFQIKQREAYLQGLEEGMGKGIGIGEANMVRRMHMNGADIDQIAVMCDMSTAEIEAMLPHKDA